MGTDIYGYVEQLNPQTEQWEVVDSEPWDHIRHYDLFALIADVRNYSCVEPIWPVRRGMPLNSFKEHEELFYGGHSLSWFMVEELAGVDWEYVVDYATGMDIDSYREYVETGKLPLCFFRIQTKWEDGRLTEEKWPFDTSLPCLSEIEAQEILKDAANCRLAKSQQRTVLVMREVTRKELLGESSYNFLMDILKRYPVETPTRVVFWFDC